MAEESNGAATGGVLLVGSVPLRSVEEVFQVMATELGDRLLLFVEQRLVLVVDVHHDQIEVAGRLDRGGGSGRCRWRRRRRGRRGSGRRRRRRWCVRSGIPLHVPCLLHHVSQFVGEQVPAVVAAGIVRSRPKRDVLPDGVGTCGQLDG